MGKVLDLSNRRFGRLVVSSTYKICEKSGGAVWLCTCDCGIAKYVYAKHLRSKGSQSCGCLKHEILIKRITTHGLTKHRLYKIWRDIRDRCCNKNIKGYSNYGGRGIIICKKWKNNFKEFFKYVTALPQYETLKTLDRIDNNGNYEPGNMRWANYVTQCYNQRKPSSKNKNLPRGVSFNTKRNASKPFRSLLYFNNKKLHLGYYATIEEAAQAYKTAALKFHGYLPQD